MYPIVWEGEGVNEVGKYNGRIVVKVNPKFFRLAEVNHLLGDSSKARNELGWSPRTNFKELVKKMAEEEQQSNSV